MNQKQISSRGTRRPDLGDRRWRGFAGGLSGLFSDGRALIQNIRLNMNLGQSDREHLFILGLSRSGTSLLATRVASSQDVATVNGETFFFQKRDFSRVDISGVELANYRAKFLAARSQVELFDAMADHAILQKPSARRFLEKTPDHIFMLPELLKAYPKARFVFSIRDPRDAYVSWQKHPQLGDAPVEEFARYWNRCHATYSASAGDRIATVRYEDMCLNPDATLERVANHFGLTQIADTAEQTKEGSDWRYLKMGGHQRITDAINPGTLNAWKDILDPDAARVIEQQCRNGMQHWQYV